MEKHSLQFEIDSSKAASGVKTFDAAIDGAIKSAGRLDSSLSKIFTKIESSSSKGFSSLAKDLSKLNGISISSKLGENLSLLSVALKGFKGPSANSIQSLSELSKALSKFTVSGSIANRIAQISAALSNLKVSATTSKNIASLSTALASLRVPAGLSSFVSVLSSLTSAATNASLAFASLNTQVSRGKLNGITSSANSAQNALNSLGAGAISTRTAIAAISSGTVILGIKSLTSSVLEAAFSMTKFRSIMIAATGSMASVDKELVFVKNLANDLGVPLLDTAERFAKFAIAGKSAGVTMADNEKIFKSLSVALTASGASANGASLAFLAVEQMMSKGKVSTEELRRQLAEQLPGAFGIMADALGVSTSALDGMLRKGEVMSADALPKFADALMRTFGPGLATAIEGPAVAMGRLQNAMTEVFLTIGSSGFIAALTTQMNSLAAAFASPQFHAFAVVVGQLAGVITTVLGTALSLMTSNVIFMTPVIVILSAAIVRMGLSAATSALQMGGLSTAMISMSTAAISFGPATTMANTAFSTLGITALTTAGRFTGVSGALRTIAADFTAGIPIIQIFTTVLTASYMIAVALEPTLTRLYTNMGLMSPNAISAADAMTLLNTVTDQNRINSNDAGVMLNMLTNNMKEQQAKAGDLVKTIGYLQQAWNWIHGVSNDLGVATTNMNRLAESFSTGGITAKQLEIAVKNVNMAGASKETISYRDSLLKVAQESIATGGVINGPLKTAVEKAAAAARLAGEDTAAYDKILQQLASTSTKATQTQLALADSYEKASIKSQIASDNANLLSNSNQRVASTARAATSSLYDMASASSTASAASANVPSQAGHSGGRPSTYSGASSSSSDSGSSFSDFMAGIRTQSQSGGSGGGMTRQQATISMASTAAAKVFAEYESRKAAGENVGLKLKSLGLENYGVSSYEIVKLLDKVVNKPKTTASGTSSGLGSSGGGGGGGVAAGSYFDALNANTNALNASTNSDSSLLEKLYNKLDLARKNLSAGYTTTDKNALWNAGDASFRGLPGYATGGSGVVRGMGGRDKNPVAMRLSRGEGVTVTPKSEMGKPGSGGANSFVINFNGITDGSSIIKNREAIDSVIRNAVKRSMNTGKVI